MIIIKIWNYLVGYLVIRVRGTGLEKFINLCSAENIYLRDVIRIQNTLQVKMSLHHFKKIRSIARKTKCRVYIEAKRGLPFVFTKLKKRKLLMLGGILFLVILYMLSSIIWYIDVIGVKTLKKEEILDQLESLGFETGIWKHGIDLKNIENELLLNNQQISWVNIKIKGIKAIVEIVEKTPPPPIKSATPCNVVARDKGLITEIMVLKGEPVVKEGDMVEKGQVLISGIIEIEGAQPYYVHADGKVTAKKWYKKGIEVPVIEHFKVKTGNKKVVYKMRVGDREVFLNNPDLPFKDYVVEKETKTFFKWRNMKLSVEFIKEIFYETREQKRFIGVERAFRRGKKKLIDLIKQNIPEDAEILSITFDKKVIPSKRRVRVDVVVETQENIGVKEPLNILNLPQIKEEWIFERQD